MGSPLSPTLSNVFLCHYEKNWFNEHLPQFKPVVYRRYVDDIFVLFKSKEHLKLFVNYMKSKHNSIKLPLKLKIFRCQNYPKEQTVCYFDFLQSHI